MKTEMRVAEPYWLQRQMSRHIEQSDSDENNSSGTTTSSDSKRPPIPRLSPTKNTTATSVDSEWPFSSTSATVYSLLLYTFCEQDTSLSKT